LYNINYTLCRLYCIFGEEELADLIEVICACARGYTIEQLEQARRKQPTYSRRWRICAGGL